MCVIQMWNFFSQISYLLYYTSQLLVTYWFILKKFWIILDKNNFGDWLELDWKWLRRKILIFL
jgi:hypothetical protein